MFVVPSLITLTHNTCAQTIQCASMQVVLVAVEAISNHLSFKVTLAPLDRFRAALADGPLAT